MTQPSFAPVPEADQVRPALRLKTPSGLAGRPGGGLRRPEHIRREPASGIPGPTRATRSSSATTCSQIASSSSPGETSRGRRSTACAMVASARPALFGRAPVGPDLEMALTLFGYLGGAPQDLVEWRRRCFSRSSHHYERAATTGRGGAGGDTADDGCRRSVSDSADWRELLDTPTLDR